MTKDPELEYVKAIKEAVSKGDDGALLEALNDYIGILRELGKNEDAYKIADQIKALLEKLGLNGTVAYATSYLNIATAYRMGGRLSDSLDCYDVAEDVYKNALPADSFLYASLYNNKALLYQEMGRINDSIEYLKKALDIVSGTDSLYETAVTYANLANSYIAIGDKENAYCNAISSKKTFESINNYDTHYASALYVLGIITDDRDLSAKYLRTAMETMKRELGENEFYFRIKNELEKRTDCMKGMDLALGLYRDHFKKVIETDFSEYKDKIAVGLVGRGSDCFGYDDEQSRDHDWGPGFLVWVDKETYDAIGERLSKAYDALPKEYKGYKCAPVVSGHKRRGVFIIEDFYRELLGKWPIEDADYLMIPDYAFATAVNGQVFADPLGAFTSIRNKLLEGYPRNVLLKKVAQSASLFSQKYQYNYKRALVRGDEITASVFKAEGLMEAMKLAHYLENKYPPHDKWLYKSLESLEMGPDIRALISSLYNGVDPDVAGGFFANYMYANGFISDTDDYIDHHAEELLFKSSLVVESHEALVDRIVRSEFEAFDEVENEGGRASCQDDFFTFDIMRKSQYLTWTDEMLIQLIYDFEFEERKGHNLITEKYGRMMESTAPIRYAEIKDNFPEISEEKKQVIESIVGIQVGWMEAFAAEYPRLAGKARSIHTYEDNPYNTSYETYLRGEISTYSDKMLQLYGGFIAGYAKTGKNLAYDIMTNTVHLYGYSDLDSAK